MQDCIIPAHHPRLSADELKARHEAGQIVREHTYLAGWIHPDGTIVSVPAHADAGDYDELWRAGYARLVVEVAYGNNVSFQAIAGVNAEQARTLIDLAVTFWATGGRASIFPHRPWKDTVERSAFSRSDFISLVREFQRTPIDA